MANFITSLVDKLKALFEKEAPKVLEVATTAISLYDKALPYVEEVAATGFVPEKIVAFLQKYGQPVETALASAVAGGVPVLEADLKNLAFKAVTAIVEEAEKLTTTQSGIATLLALLVSKFA